MLSLLDIKFGVLRAPLVPPSRRPVFGRSKSLVKCGGRMRGVSERAFWRELFSKLRRAHFVFSTDWYCQPPMICCFFCCSPPYVFAPVLSPMFLPSFSQADSRRPLAFSDPDPRIIFALCNATVSSPHLRIFRPETVEEQLNDCVQVGFAFLCPQYRIAYLRLTAFTVSPVGLPQTLLPVRISSRKLHFLVAFLSTPSIIAIQ